MTAGAVTPDGGGRRRPAADRAPGRSSGPGSRPASATYDLLAGRALACPARQMSLKTDQLRYFVTVAEEGQITRAAKKLYIAQPALSQAIAQLESELGLQLLERHAKGVRLTAAGEAFLEKARAVVETEREVSLTAESLARAARACSRSASSGRHRRWSRTGCSPPSRRRIPTARSASASCRSPAANRAPGSRA